MACRQWFWHGHAHARAPGTRGFGLQRSFPFNSLSPEIGRTVDRVDTRIVLYRENRQTQVVVAATAPSAAGVAVSAADLTPDF